MLAPVEDIRHLIHGIHIDRHVALTIFSQLASSDAEHSPFANDLFFIIQSLEQHAIGMERKDYFGFPNDFSRSLQCVEDGPIRHMALTGGGKAAVKRHLITIGIRITVVKDLSRLLRSHGMATRRANTYFVDVFDCFHSGYKDNHKPPFFKSI